MLACFTLLAACSNGNAARNPDAGNGSGDTDEGSGDNRPDLADCEDNLDCRGGEVCRDGSCRESCSEDDPCQGELGVCDVAVSYCVQCDDDGGCEAGQRCIAAWCETFCDTDEQCPIDRYCDFPTGECFVPDCFEDSDCAGGERCSDLRCVSIDAPVDETCRGDADCERGEICNRGVCEPLDGPDCTSSAQCRAGEVCVSGECIAESSPDCSSDAECRGGERCDNGFCVAIEVPDCVSAADCGQGETCRDGECEAVSAAECSENAQCGAGQECVFGSCIAVVTPPECASDFDCFATEFCREGFCVDRDSGDNACPIVTGGCRVRSSGSSFSTFVVAEPGDVIECSGVGSYDPDGTIERYVWTLGARPAASSARFDSTAARDASFTADAEGSYAIELSAFDNGGAAACSILDVTVATSGDTAALRIELTWDTPGDRDQTDDSGADLDIYLRNVTRGGCWTSTAAICNYAKKTPDWGVAGDATDNPSLDLDDLNGAGPEVISYNRPAAGRYDLGVHYFNDNDFGESTATVRVFVNGDVVFERRRTLLDMQFWSVGSITFPSEDTELFDELFASKDTATCR